jgi:hypothetical protein
LHPANPIKDELKKNEDKIKTYQLNEKQEPIKDN